jgi:hypothetical protein
MTRVRAILPQVVSAASAPPGMFLPACSGVLASSPWSRAVPGPCERP